MSNWIAKATSKHKGAFSAKAKAAGKTTREFAAEHKGSPGTLGKQARLAATLMGMHPGSAKPSAASTLYPEKK